MSAPTAGVTSTQRYAQMLDNSTNIRFISSLVTAADAARRDAADHQERAEFLRAEAADYNGDSDVASDFLRQADLEDQQAQALVAVADGYETTAQTATVRVS